MAQTQVTSVSQDELSKILAGNVDSIITPDDPGKPTDTAETVKEDEKNKVEPIKSETVEPALPADFKWSDLNKDEDDKEPKEDKKPEEGTTPTDEKDKDEKKSGRKPAEFVAIVNELIEAGDLLPFEGEDSTVKTIEEAKELLKLNMKQKEEASEEDVRKAIKASYSPQIQAILEYADQGGQDIRPLMSAIAEVEKTADIDINTEGGQVSVITEYLKLTGLEDEDIQEFIETQKDLDKLKKKAEDYLPKLNQMKTERIQLMMEEQAAQKKQIEETRKTYLGIIQETLNKEKLSDLKLSRQEKQKLWASVVDTNYRSFNGTPTNAFYKKLEDLQVGKTADYDHFLELVYFAVDREGYKQKLIEELKTQTASETVKKLKVQNQKATSSVVAEDQPKKPAISRGFKPVFG